MELKEVVFNLSNAAALGSVNTASVLAQEIISEYTTPKKLSGLGFYALLSGKSDYTIMLEAHIDEVGMVVTNVSDDGFLTVSACGGIDVRNLPSCEVVVHSKSEVKGVFISTPPHLAKGDTQYTDIKEVKIDTGLGKEAKNIVSVGDFVTFNTKAESLLGTKFVGKSLDDRIGCAVLLELAKRLSGKKLPVNVLFVFNDAEELGLRGARTSAFKLNFNEAVCIDATFGNAPNISNDKTFKLGEGVLIGISPFLDKEVTKKLQKVAKENGVLFGVEVMSSATGTNADVISVTKEGAKTALVSVPVRNMHTAVEVADLLDIEQTVSLLQNYVLAGGIKE